MHKVINKLKSEYKINDEIFYLKNIKRNYFLNTYIFDNLKQKYKYVLEQFKIENDELHPLSDIINSDIVITISYVNGIYENIMNGELIPIKINDMTKEDLNIKEIYEDKPNKYYDDLDSWRREK